MYVNIFGNSNWQCRTYFHSTHAYLRQNLLDGRACFCIYLTDDDLCRDRNL